jgi:hypothetical protein
MWVAKCNIDPKSKLSMGGQNVKSIYQNGTFLVEFDDCVKSHPKILIPLN